MDGQNVRKSGVFWGDGSTLCARHLTDIQVGGMVVLSLPEIAHAFAVYRAADRWKSGWAGFGIGLESASITRTRFTKRSALSCGSIKERSPTTRIVIREGDR
jgi:hypothetical protein